MVIGAQNETPWSPFLNLGPRWYMVAHLQLVNPSHFLLFFVTWMCTSTTPGAHLCFILVWMKTLQPHHLFPNFLNKSRKSIWKCFCKLHKCSNEQEQNKFGDMSENSEAYHRDLGKNEADLEIWKKEWSRSRDLNVREADPDNSWRELIGFEQITVEMNRSEKTWGEEQ